jgi:hypothetical protein
MRGSAMVRHLASIQFGSVEPGPEFLAVESTRTAAMHLAPGHAAGQVAGSPTTTCRRSRQTASRRANNIAAILQAPVIEKILEHLGAGSSTVAQGAGARVGGASSWLSRSAALPHGRPGGGARRVGTTLSAAGSTLGLRPMQRPASGAGPVESAQRGDRGANSKHFRPPRAGPGHSLGSCWALMPRAFEAPMLRSGLHRPPGSCQSN